MPFWMPPFALVAVARMRAIGGRSRRIEEKLDLLIEAQRRMERMMSDNDSAIVARLQRLQDEVNAYTTQQGRDLAEARKALATAEAAGRAAQKEEDQKAAEADKQAALAKIEEISGSLIRFSPSAN